ncbi:hypothetical protein [Ignavibacterium sp.]|uniref:hypothetical protein n=1 Tax=Ignavibacterium sp. TaxID=2651167 RepID=UPI0021F99A2F|nr:hypothetical protein [Ignavibacterium sp.]BDQ03482.1 MAG: hypothetical protein KatS3mg037_2057 [Ignavibacterium sp.]
MQEQRATDIDELTYGTIQGLFSDTDRVLNRKIKIEFKLRGIKYEAGTYHNLNGTVNVIYFNVIVGSGYQKRNYSYFSIFGI